MLALIILVSLVQVTAADEERYFQGTDGRTYRETRRIVREPVNTTKWQSQQQTVYRQQIRQSNNKSLQAFYTPVTEYRWVSRLHGRWNLLATPYYTHDLVPVTRWELRAKEQTFPAWKAEWVPETRTVQVPVTTQQMAEKEIITRVAVAPPRSGVSGNAVARQPAFPTVPRTAFRPTPIVQPFGGVALPSDPPRQPTAWRSRGEVLRRY